MQDTRLLTASQHNIQTHRNNDKMLIPPKCYAHVKSSAAMLHLFELFLGIPCHFFSFNGSEMNLNVFLSSSLNHCRETGRHC